MAIVSLRSWADGFFDPPPSDYVLKGMRLRGQIIPRPVKIGRAWFVDKDAQVIESENTSGDPLIDRIVGMV